MTHKKRQANRHRFASELLSTCTVLLLAFLFSLQCSNHLWHTGNIKTDSSVFYYVARVMAKGGMPYKDTFDHKGPLLYVLNLIGQKIDPWSGIWVVEVLFLMGAFYLMYRTARLLCSRPFSIAAVLAAGALLYEFFDGGNYTEEYALLFIAGAQYIFADYFLNKKITALRLILCGAAFGAVLMLRPNMAALWVVMCLGVLYQCIRDKEAANLARFLLFFLAGTLLVCVPFCIWLTAGGAFGEFIECYLKFNALYTASTRGDLQTAYRVEAFNFFLRYRIALIAGCVSVFFSYRSKRLCDVLHAVFFFASFVFLCISAESYKHYGIVLVPALIYPFACIGEEAKRKRSRDLMTVYAALYLLPVLLLPNWLTMADKAFYDYATRKQEFYNDCDKDALEVIYENSEEGEDFIVCGNWDNLYNLTGRFAVSYYSYQNMPCSLDPARMDQFFEDVKKAQPGLIVMADGSAVEGRMMEYINENHYTEIFRKKYSNFGSTIYKKEQ